jgi:hypothetical protein
MKNAGLAIVLLFSMLIIGLVNAQEEEFELETEITGAKFSSNQSVSGVGFANSYKYLTADPNVFHSQSSGSGAYSYDSATVVQLDIETKSNGDSYDFFDDERKIDVQESVSAAYLAYVLNIPGTFKIGPIKSLWRDASCGGNVDGAAIRAIFDEAGSLNKEMIFKSSGTGRYIDLSGKSDASGTLDASMDLKASFNGTGRFGMVEAEVDDKFSPSLPRPSRKDSRTLIDEFYRGAFSLEKKMAISIKATNTQNDDDWLPCCFGGYLTEPKYYQKGSKGFGTDLTSIFDCNCSKLMPPSNCSK